MPGSIEGKFDVTWFAGVPHEIRVADVCLIHAEQAIEVGEPEGDVDGDLWEHGERPSPDWVSAQVFDLIRLQLVELHRVVQQILGGDGSIGDIEDVRSVLLGRAQRLPEPESNAAEYEIETIMEGLALLDGLPSESHVRHGFAVDGTITMTTGPTLPTLPAIGVRGNATSELEDEPDYLLSVAASLTRSAGQLYWLLPPI